MHQVVRVVVPADSEEEALEKAEGALEYSLLNREVTDRGRDGPCDYFKFMHNGNAVSGAGRWDQYRGVPSAIPTDTERGQEEIEDAWDLTYEELADALTRVRSAFEDAEDIEELANNEGIRATMHTNPWSVSLGHYLHYIGWYGDESSLYPISTPDRYEELQEKLDGTYVVPVDVHA